MISGDGEPAPEKTLTFVNQIASFVKFVLENTMYQSNLENTVISTNQI
jgi:hypothetical protein